MTVQDLEDILGYLGAQAGRLLVIAGMVATALIGESSKLELTSFEHRCLIVVSILGSSIAAYVTPQFRRRDDNGNYPPKE